GGGGGQRMGGGGGEGGRRVGEGGRARGGRPMSERSERIRWLSAWGISSRRRAKRGDATSDSERGQQRVRTRLAWLRTALLATVISLLAARLAVGHRLPVRGLLGVIVATELWLMGCGFCHLRTGAI